MLFRMHVIQAVFKRNFLSYFSSVIGYLFIVAFVGLGSFLAFSPQFFGNNLANLDQLNQHFPVLLLFIVPAITMSAWSDERKQGTDELLFTLPASDLEILLGKYFAVLGIYTVALVFSLSHVVVLSLLGSPDLGLMFATYFGYWLCGAALLSAGLVASVLTSSPTVAYVLGAMICAVPVFIDRLAPNNRLLQGLSVAEQFRDFGLGMIPLGGVLYFVSLTALMLYLNLVFVSRRHWSGGPHRTPMGLHFFVRAVSLGLILIGVNVVAANATTRVDLTSERLYSLSSTTREVLEQTDPEHPIRIQAFISPEVPRDYAATRSTLVGLLRQFDQEGGNAVRVRIVDTDKFTDEADEARRYGIEPRDIQSERAGRIVQEDVFLGVVVTGGGTDSEVVIPFFDVGTPVEYELTRAVRTASHAKRLTLGVLRTDAKLAGGFDMQSFQSQREWQIITELKRQYEVKEVAPEDLATSKFDVLLAAMPSSLTEPEMRNFVDYVRKGGKTLVIDDPLPLFHMQLAPRLPKPRAGGGGMFGGQQQSPPKADNGEARQLCNLLGISWNSSETVWDTYNPHPEMSEAFKDFDVVYVAAESGGSMPFNNRSSVTDGLQEVMMFYPGEIKPVEGSKLDFLPLMRTSPNSFVLPWDDFATSNPFGMIQLLPVPKRKKLSGVEYVVGARVTGVPADADSSDKNAPKIDVVFIADLDMISNEFFMVRDKNWRGLKLDNITVVMNAVDALAGDESFIELRKRRAHHRTLTTVERQTEIFRTRQLDQALQAGEAADKQLAEAQQRFAKEIQKIQADKSLDERTKMIRVRTAQENERRRLEVEKAEIDNKKNKEIREFKDQSERQIRKIESGIRWMAILFPPIPALLLGMYVFSKRVREERQGIVSDRMVPKRR